MSRRWHRGTQGGRGGGGGGGGGGVGGWGVGGDARVTLKDRKNSSKRVQKECDGSNSTGHDIYNT